MTTFFKSSMFLSALAFVVGCSLHALQFGFVFVGSPQMWWVLTARAIGAGLLGWVSARFQPDESKAARWVRIGLYETGALLMLNWAVVNFSATRAVGFDVSFWLLPALVNVGIYILAAHKASSPRH